jgi:hypothetical protein
MNARNSLAGALGAAIICGAVVAGCSGGAGTTPQSNAMQPTNTGQPGSTTQSSSQTAAVKISIVVPSKSAAASNRRRPSYVSPATSTVIVTANPGNVNAGTIACASGTCTGTAQVPLSTTSLTLQLENTDGAVLSEATEAVTITPGVANTPAPFVFNGVVSTFAVSNAPVTQLVIAYPTTIPVTITPEDASGYPIQPPGNLIDANQNVLISASGSTQTIALAPVPHITPGVFAWNATNYTLTETASYDGGDPGTSTVDLTPISTVAGDGPYTAQQSALAVNQKALFVIAGPTPIPTVNGFPAYQIATSGAAASTTTSIEFPLATPSPVAVSLSISTNFNDGGSTLTLSNDSCSGPYVTGLAAAFPSPLPSTPPGGAMMPLGGAPYTFNISASSGSGAGQCNFTVTDANNLSALTTISFDSTTVTVSGKARRK